ncbi:MAG: hypothetical protein A2V67_13570 [Deltaproteobacteria bacterium RBG_13_61_14]|nr:MAG: hypothetical protein A2V67_13570 [Deltaproteobacteria bacterium RBG_13_61_14]
MKRTFFLVVAAVLLLAGGEACQRLDPPPDLKALLPESGEIPGFERDGEASLGQGFEGLARIIDGAAEKYVEFSAERGIFQDYAIVHERGEIVSVAIYQAGDAGKLFREGYEGRRRPEPGIGQEARARLDLVGATALDFYQGPFYVELSINCGRPEAIEHLRQFAEAITRRIRTSS